MRFVFAIIRQCGLSRLTLNLYYIPSELNITELVARYSNAMVSDWTAETDVALGYAKGDNHEDSVTYRASG